eukprot:gene15734-biopygen10551
MLAEGAGFCRLRLHLSSVFGRLLRSQPRSMSSALTATEHIFCVHSRGACLLRSQPRSMSSALIAAEHVFCAHSRGACAAGRRGDARGARRRRARGGGAAAGRRAAAPRHTA